MLHFIHGGHSGGISTGCMAVFLKHIHISVMYHTAAVSVSILKSTSFLIFVSINAFDGPRHPVSYDDIIIQSYHFCLWMDVLRICNYIGSFLQCFQ